jgi:glutamine---fructose-6-phosphate transaminase (isomerizing)
MKALDSETSKAIRNAPEALRRQLDRSPLDKEASRLAGRRVWLIGLGTSYHAALTGQHLFRSVGADVRAARSFDFALYPPKLGPADAVVALSHSGRTRYTRDAVSLARKAGAFTVSITASGVKDTGAEAGIETVPPEASNAHTVSYLAALVELGRLALALGEREQLRPSWAGDWARTPGLIESVLVREKELDEPAKHAAAAAAIYAFGGGPNAATAFETALKLKEMAHLSVEPVELETALHGPLTAVNRGDLALLFAAPGPALERMGDLSRALDAIGAKRWTVGPGASAGFAIDGVDELWTPAAYAVVGQLLSLKLAGLKGTQPDTMRCDEPDYERAFDSYRF